MSKTPYIGERLELISMDRYCPDISIALYRQPGNDNPGCFVHTYSTQEGAQQRIDFLTAAMKTIGGLQATEDKLLRFDCGHDHELAMKRLFLDCCKLDPSGEIRTAAMTIHDKKANCSITATHVGGGVYQVAAEDDEQDNSRRVTAIARGLLKLGQLDEVQGCDDKISFACGQSHDALIGMLLIRAPNVRAAFREAEMMASRGVLTAPSSQD